MSSIIMILVVLVCIVLSLVILVQNPKGGGLASGFSSANQIGGVKRTTDFLEKSTWTLVIALMLLSVVSSTLMRPGGDIRQTERGEVEELIESQPTMPQQGQPAPAQELPDFDFDED